MAKLFPKFRFPALPSLSSDHRAGLLGVGWTTLGQVAILAIRLVSSLILPHLLGVGDYGVFGIAIAVLMIVEFLSDIGLRPALIRHPDGERETFIATAWMLMIGRGFVLAFAIVILGLVLPRFYPEYDSKLFFAVLAVLAMRPIMHACANPMAMLLHRHMKFGRWALLELGQTVVGTSITLICAYYFRNVWAIVVGVLCGEVGFIVLTYLLCHRPPRPRWNREVASELSHFGNQVFINTLIMAVWVYVDRLVGPAFMPPVQMGIYIFAWNLMEHIERLATKACDVYYSTLTRVKDPVEQVRFHRSICRKVALFGMPFLAMGIIVGPWLVQALFPPDFHPAGTIFSILVCRVMLRILGQLQFQLLLARAEIYLATRCYVFALIVQIAIIFPLSWEYGIAGIAWSVVISTFCLTLSQNLVMVRRRELNLESLAVTTAYAAAGYAAVFYLNP